MDKYKQLLTHVLTFAVAIVTATLSIDSRYAHSDEIDKYKSDMREFLIGQQRIMEKNIVATRLQMVDDEIFALQLKTASGKADDIDKAMLGRYSAQREMLKNGTSYTEIDSMQKIPLAIESTPSSPRMRPSSIK